MEASLDNLFKISVVAFLVPFLLGFFPRLRVPSVVVEIVTGIVVGPAVLGWIQFDAAVALMSKLGVAFLLFLAGLELNLAWLRGPPLVLGVLGFALSVAIGLAGAVPLAAAGIILTPLLVAVSLSSTSVGIVVPVLSDTGNLHGSLGRFTVAGGAAAEFGSIVVLGLLFAVPHVDSVAQGLVVAAVLAIVLAIMAALVAVMLWLVARFVSWTPGQRVAAQLDDTSAQLRTRFAVMLVLGAAVVAAGFGFEAILGTFVAGIFLGGLMRGDPNERLYRTRLEAIGFGFFVPVFFIASGMRLDVAGLLSRDELIRIGIFLVLLLLARGLPALLYRRHLTARETGAAGLMLATNVSFIVVAVEIGLQLKQIRPVTGSSLVIAGLLSAILFPALAQGLLASGPRGSTTAAGGVGGPRPDPA